MEYLSDQFGSATLAMFPPKILPTPSLSVRAECWGDSADIVRALISRSQSTGVSSTPFQLPMQSTKLLGRLWGKLTPFQPKHFSIDLKQKTIIVRFSKYQITWGICVMAYIDIFDFWFICSREKTCHKEFQFWFFSFQWEEITAIHIESGSSFH